MRYVDPSGHRIGGNSYGGHATDDAGDGSTNSGFGGGGSGAGTDGPGGPDIGLSTGRWGRPADLSDNGPTHEGAIEFDPSDPNTYDPNPQGGLYGTDPLGADVDDGYDGWGQMTTGVLTIVAGTTTQVIGAGVVAFGIGHSVGTLGLTTPLGIAHMGAGFGTMWVGGWMINIGMDAFKEGWEDNEESGDPCN